MLLDGPLLALESWLWSVTAKKAIRDTAAAVFARALLRMLVERRETEKALHAMACIDHLLKGLVAGASSVGPGRALWAPRRCCL